MCNSNRDISGRTINTEDVQMSFTTIIVAIFLASACIATTVALMRLFDAKDATAEQVQAEVGKLLAQANREVKNHRRVRAGTAIVQAMSQPPNASTP